MKKFFLVLIIVVFFALLIYLLIYILKKTKKDNFFSYYLNGKKYLLLVADEPKEWEKGLMNYRKREELGGADGMIFIFPNKEYRTFWNKNTYLDLKVYWIEDKEVVGQDFLPSINQSNELVYIHSPLKVNKVIELVLNQ